MKMKNPINKSYIPQEMKLAKQSTLIRLSLFTENLGFDPLIANLTRIINQGRVDKMKQSAISNFFKLQLM